MNCKNNIEIMVND